MMLDEDEFPTLKDDTDYIEEMYNAMAPFMESCEKVFDAGWNINDIAKEIDASGATVEVDRLGDLVVYPNLRQAPDGSLWRVLDEE